MKKYRGIIPPLVTPIDEVGEVCERSVRNLIDFVRPYSEALMPCLSTGEGWALKYEQWERMFLISKKYADDLPVLVGVEVPTTEEVVERAREAKVLGADAVVVTTPFRKNLSQEEIYDHFRTVRESVDIPIFLYNESSISGNCIEPETVKRICELEDVVGIKEASGSIEITKSLLAMDLGVPIFQGWENLCLDSRGVDGYILPLSNIEPLVCLEMLENPTKSGQEKLDAACREYNILGKDWYVYVKKELKRIGIIASDKVV